jgi:hypothetical protein
VTAETLPDFLARQGRQATDPQLAFAATFGVIVAATALFRHPRGWVYFTASGVTCAAFGLWGICDRLLAEQGELRVAAKRILAFCRFVCGATGAVGGAGLLLSVLFLALGMWVS